MSNTQRAMTAEALIDRLGRAGQPVVVDVRLAEDFAADPCMLPGSLRGSPEDWGRWAVILPPTASIVVYCAHGRAVSQNVQEALSLAGLAACYLEGGLEEWRRCAGPVVTRPRAARVSDAPSLWITREHPKIDRIACPWLVRRFVDPRAVFLYVPPGEVARMAELSGATTYDVAGAELGHHGELCSFDAFIARYGIVDPVLARLAMIVRGADTGVPDLTPQSAGLLAVSHGLSRLSEGDDQAMLEQGMLVYDALYAWCRAETARTRAAA